MKGYVELFKTTLEDNFLSVRGRKLKVEWSPIKKAKKKKDDDEGTASESQGVMEEKKEM